MTISINDIITTDGYLNFCRDNNIPYIKTDCFDQSPFYWRGEYHSADVLSNICVVGHSDKPITNEIAKKFDLIFGINNISTSKNCYGLPLGITNDCDDSPLHKIYGNKEIMLEVINKDINKTNLLYMNFDTKTYPSERNNVFNLFCNKKWVNIGRIENTLDGRKIFLKDVKSSKFVLCPRGNGIDTHRLWEALYMGSIPIVKYENIHKHFIDLPILFISDWNHINENFLNEKYDKIIDQEYDIEKLKISYWFNFIKTKIEGLNERSNKP
jgi:hypothetical protein